MRGLVFVGGDVAAEVGAPGHVAAGALGDPVGEGLRAGEGLASFADRVVGLGRGFGVEVDGDLVDVGVVEQYLG